MKKTKTFLILVFTIIFYLTTFSMVPSLVSGKISDGEVELNNGLINMERLFKRSQQLSPSSLVSSNEIRIKNTGSLPLKMYEQFTFSLLKEGYSKRVLKEMLDKYLIKTHLNINGKEIANGEWVNLKDFNSSFNEIKGREIGTIRPGEKISLTFDVKLDESANNNYQGAKLDINFIAFGVVSVGEGEEPSNPGNEEDPSNPEDEEEPSNPGDEEEPSNPGDGKDPLSPEDREGQKTLNSGLLLPSTSTNIFNLLLIGSILIVAGTIMYFAYRRRIIISRKM